MTLNHHRRVVVTGLGAISPLGSTFVDSWKGLMSGKCGVTNLATALQHQGLNEEQLEQELELIRNLPCQVAAPVRNCPVDTRTTARFVQFALAAAHEAIEQSGLMPWLGLSVGADQDTDQVDHAMQARRQRTGVCIASGMSSVREITQAYTTLLSSYRKLSPHFVPKVLTNSASGRVALQYNLQGSNHACATACAAGSHAIGDAYRMVQSGGVDIMIAGGSEAALDPLSLAGFGRLRALSTTFNDFPERASRPFDRDRDGFVMGEGAAILVIEALDNALERQAPILAEITGYGLTGDAHHVTAPDPRGQGAIRCMQHALDEHYSLHDTDSHSSFQRYPIHYVNAHATSTPKGDEIEANAIDSVFSERKISVSSTKGATGHLLGAAGALEAAFCVQAIVDQWLPPTLNLEESDVGGCKNLDLLTQKSSRPLYLDDSGVQAVMTNSFGFGGTNASLVLQRWSN